MKRVSVLLPEAEAERFDLYCKEAGHKKSTLIARLIREHLEQHQFAIQGNILGKDYDRETPSR